MKLHLGVAASATFALLILITTTPVQSQNCPNGGTGDDCVTNIAAVAGAAGCPLEGLPEAPRPLIHSDQDIFVGGPWRVKQSVLDAPHAEGVSGYNGVPADRFLTQTMALPSGPKVVKMMHYAVDGDPEKFGYRLVPVADRQGGSAELDALLRESMGLGPNDPIFAQVGSNHPEAWNLDLANMGDKYAPQSGVTHSRAYLGLGRPIDSPANYHDRVWKAHGYPFTIYTLELEGEPFKVTNQNAQIAWITLVGPNSKRVRFPGAAYGMDYKNDTFKTIDLATNLWFYENWIRIQAGLRPDVDLLSNKDFFTYCRESASIAENIALNVPHNERAFKEIWGDAEGGELWDAINKAWPKIVADRRAVKRGGEHEATLTDRLPETDFEPLWKKEGITDPINATWDRLVSEGKPGWAGTTMPPQTSADLVLQTIANYVPFVEAGGALTSAALLGFKAQIADRTGMGSPSYRNLEGAPDIVFTDDVYVDVALPIMAKLQIADALAENISSGAELDAFVERRTAELAGTFAMGETPTAEQIGLAQGIMSGFADPQTRGLITGCGQLTRGQAWTWLRGAIQPDLEKARSLPVCDGCVRWYQQPAGTHWAALGIWPTSEFVNVKGVATVMMSTELERNGAGDQIASTPVDAPPPAGAETKTVKNHTLTVGQRLTTPNGCNFRKTSNTQGGSHGFRGRIDAVVKGFDGNWVRLEEVSTGKVGFFGPGCWN